MYRLLLTGIVVALLAVSLSGQPGVTQAPKIWTEDALKDWFNPVVGVNARPNHYSEAEFYAVPIDNLRTYPVYHPDREPPGYLDSLRRRGAQPMLELGKARTREGWIEAGRV